MSKHAGSPWIIGESVLLCLLGLAMCLAVGGRATAAPDAIAGALGGLAPMALGIVGLAVGLPRRASSVETVRAPVSRR